MLGIACDKGLSVYAGEGQNVWAAVHRFDAARLFRLALEKGVAGARYHATAEEGVPFRRIAEVIGRRLGVPTVSKSPEAAAEHFGWFAHFAAMDALASSQRTRDALGWKPTGPGLIEESASRPISAGDDSRVASRLFGSLLDQPEFQH